MDAKAATRRWMHVLAEHVLAGPQYVAHGTIRLRVADGELATVVGDDVRLGASGLRVGTAEVPLAGKTVAAVAELAGREACGLGEVYADDQPVGPDECIELDPTYVAVLLGALALGDEALRVLAPGVEPVVWPEHLDVAITLDQVNFGVSPGDAHIGEPYAYVGPHDVPDGAFWNEAFGASLPLGPGASAPDLVDFFQRGREAAVSAGGARST